MLRAQPTALIRRSAIALTSVRIASSRTSVSTNAFGSRDFTGTVSSPKSDSAADVSSALNQTPQGMALLLSRPSVARAVIESLSEEKRRELLVAASTLEFGANGQAEAKEAHTDAKQRHVSKDAWREWVREEVAKRTGPTVSRRTLIRIAIQAGCPFVAFGLLDNSMMLLAGDIIDGLVGERLSLSMMGAAAMGGIVSGTLGIQVHGLAERFVHRFGPARPTLHASQWRAQAVRRAIHLGGTFGIMLGLSLGMFPLLFLEYEI